MENGEKAEAAENGENVSITVKVPEESALICETNKSKEDIGGDGDGETTAEAEGAAESK